MPEASGPVLPLALLLVLAAGAAQAVVARINDVLAQKPG